MANRPQEKKSDRKKMMKRMKREAESLARRLKRDAELNAAIAQTRKDQA